MGGKTDSLVKEARSSEGARYQKIEQKQKRERVMKRKYVTLEKVGKGLAEIKGMPELVKEERNALIEEERAALRTAEFIKYARTTAHLSQGDLANELGVTQARISQMEKGDGPYGASIAVLERVAKACGGRL